MFWCFIVVAGILFAAGAKEAGKSKLTLALWDENQKPAIQKIVDQYNASQDKVEVVIELLRGIPIDET